mmetsp:Transcript_26245/g.84380  ORF Transcript_26245/g.84380 Transcript_26245/m.84380 type:complete len:285 (+) Transcript_26245:1534-2388(+)
MQSPGCRPGDLPPPHAGPRLRRRLAARPEERSPPVGARPSPCGCLRLGAVRAPPRAGAPHATRQRHRRHAARRRRGPRAGRARHLPLPARRRGGRLVWRPRRRAGVGAARDRSDRRRRAAGANRGAALHARGATQLRGGGRLALSPPARRRRADARPRPRDAGAHQRLHRHGRLARFRLRGRARRFGARPASQQEHLDPVPASPAEPLRGARGHANYRRARRRRRRLRALGHLPGGESGGRGAGGRGAFQPAPPRRRQLHLGAAAARTRGVRLSGAIKVRQRGW